MKIIYAEQALNDLIELRAYIAERNPYAAHAIARELTERLQHLCNFPQMGRLAKNPNNVVTNIREMVFGAHVVRYAHTEKSVTILRIWHHAQHRSDDT